MNARFPAQPPTFLRADPTRWELAGEHLELRSVRDLEGLRGAVTAEAQDDRSRVNPYDPYLPGHLSLLRPVDADFIDARGVVQPGAGPLPRDIGMELALELEPGWQAVQFVHEYAETYLALECRADGGAVLRRYATELTRIDGLEWPASGRVQVEFGYLDGRCYLVLEGSLVFEHEVDLPTQSRLVIDRADRFLNLLHIGVAGAGGARIHAFEVFHDAFYTATVGRFEIGPGELFVLGDNAHDSADSRDRPQDAPFELSDALGRPFAVIGPVERARWLPRYSGAAP